VLLALLALALVAAILVASLVVLQIARRRETRRPRRARRTGLEIRDPGRERRAEQRARELLRSCVNEEEWAMYRDLGFIRVWGRLGGGAHRRDRSSGSRRGDTPVERVGGLGGSGRPRGDEPPYAYLVYPHKPVVAYVPATRSLLNEYCVEFPDLTSAISHSRLPDSDDVLAKWMALTGDEERLIRNANMHLPGRQIDPARVRRDLWRLSQWERQRGDRRGSFEARNT
jgi:hypothetical protein